ncbi:MAG: transcription-repair coupling factor [Deltaproteobacteria bacterium]|nr:transcription-repair coupling factor [Deltaproteobacteria bacterium]
MYDFERKGTICVTGKIGSFVSFFVSQIKRKIFIFYDTDDEAFLTQEEIEYYAKKQVYLFPQYADKVFEQEDEGKRMGFLYHLVSDEEFVGLFPYNAINHHISSPQTLFTFTKTIVQGDIVFQEEIIEYLENCGYEKNSLIRNVGEYAKRGSIIDVYTPSYEKPVRIEFLGDRILSIRLFNPDTQRSLTELKKCTLTYVNQIPSYTNTTIAGYLNESIVFVHKGISSLTDYLPDTNDETLRKIWGDLFNSSLNINISGIQGEVDGRSIHATSNEDLRHLFNERKTELFKILSDKLKDQWSTHLYIYVFANNEHQGKRLQEIFNSYDITLPILSGISFPNKKKEWGIVIGPLRRGFRTNNIIVLTEEDIVGSKKRAIKKTWDGLDEFLTSFRDLNVGEWIVHIEHGIGIYKGILPLQINEYIKDFILIEYQDGDKLYVPVNDLHLVQKFIGSEKTKPKIDRLGSPLWKNTKKKVKQQIEDIAQDLLEMNAERQLVEGYSYSPEDELFREMESRFEFEETEGQLKTIKEVLDDMENTKPMDRLVCGDVGFGKTEIALRASFKAVLDCKQVALLVPTTILAQQHYTTFRNRLSGYPVNVEMLSRFKTKEEQRAIAELVKKGAIDIIIGTHRLLQKDIAFKDLGLLIIDEEQRFGVKHKEKLKLFKKNIDVLTLSATPIPRTLYMATMGIKDLSVIDTPPLDRFAVKTFVVQSNDTIMKKAVLDELQRGGQIFFVHNYVHNIGVVFEYLKNLLPGINIAVAHGQMEGAKLEKIMVDFINKKYDLLLSTNIIESGLDISNVNTIFINNAHKMGLSDLYQLRGRVGRSEKQAYAYLLVPKNETLTKDAALRLKIIEEMTDLGSGFHIANYDLEIRGAGNLLGKEQSGNVNLIGFELYCTMLEDALQNLRQGSAILTEDIITEINIPIDAFIPDYYVTDANQKLLMYKRLSKTGDEKELEGIKEELLDRYGVIPKPLANLLDIISLKCFLTALKIKKVDCAKKQISIHVTEHTPLDMQKILLKITDSSTKLKLLPDGRILLHTDKKAEELIHFIRNMLMDIIIL